MAVQQVGVESILINYKDSLRSTANESLIESFINDYF